MSRSSVLNTLLYERDAKLGISPAWFDNLELAYASNYVPSWVRSLRDSLGFSQEKMGDRLYSTKITIYLWERGDCVPSHESTAALLLMEMAALHQGKLDPEKGLLHRLLHVSGIFPTEEDRRKVLEQLI